MAPLALGAILFAVVKPLLKVFTGAVIASAVYFFLKNTIEPIFNRLDSAIINQISQFSTSGTTIYQVIQYLDFINCIHILLSALSACFFIKIFSVSLRAFGITVG